MDESNLTELRNKCLNSLYSCSENVSKYCDNENREQEFQNLRTCVLEYCKMECLEEFSKKTILSLETGADGAEWEHLKVEYESKLSQNNKQHNTFHNHRFVKELEKHIETAESRRAEHNNSQVLEEDVAITDTTQTYIDPISKRPINNPMRNTICNHVYDKETIESIVRNKKNKGCPYVGCTNKKTMQAQHLKWDEELQLTIDRTQQTIS